MMRTFAKEPIVDTIELTIQDMHCDSCVQRVRSALKALPGATLKTVVIGHATLESTDPAAGTRALTALQTIGFEATCQPDRSLP